MANSPFSFYTFLLGYEKGKFDKNLWNIYNLNPN